MTSYVILYDINIVYLWIYMYASFQKRKII